MAEYHLVVLTNPVPGKEEEFREWYDNRHLPDLLNVPGITGAVRFQRIDESSWGSLAIYKLSSDEPKAVLDTILARWKTDILPTSEAFDETRFEMILMEKTRQLGNA